MDVEKCIYECKINNGTHYYKYTSDEMVRLLENLRIKKTRIQISYGDTKTGRDWNDGCTFGQVGTIG